MTKAHNKIRQKADCYSRHQKTWTIHKENKSLQYLGTANTGISKHIDGDTAYSIDNITIINSFAQIPKCKSLLG
jgi:hypothetical protein